MTKRRTLLLIIAAVLLPLVGLVTCWAMPPKPGLTFDHFSRCYQGMTTGEVESVLGAGEGRSTTAREFVEFWGERGEIRIRFVDGRAVYGVWQVGDFYHKLRSDWPGPAGILWFCFKDWTGNLRKVPPTFPSNKGIKGG